MTRSDHPPRPRSDPPESKLQKKLQWYKWLGGSVIAIFIAGFFVAQYLGNYATTEAVQNSAREYQAEHGVAHNKLDARVERIERQTTTILVEQARHSERQKLLNTRIELMLERADPPGRTVAARRRERTREDELEAQVRVQERRVEAIERDPTAGLPSNLIQQEMAPPAPR